MKHFTSPPGKLGNEGAPGYADRAMMRLAREITGSSRTTIGKHHRQIAFLTSDCLGAV